MKDKIPSFLLDKSPSPAGIRQTGGLSTSFLDKAIGHISGFVRTSYIQWEMASRDGFFQRMDARVKVLFLTFLIIIVSLKKDIVSEIVIGVFLLILVALSRLDLPRFYGKVLTLGFLFGFLVALPSSLNIFSRGDLLLPLFHLSRPHEFWIYHIPETIGLTREGILGVLMLTTRVINSLTATFFLLYTTPLSEVIKALKVFRLPDTMLMVIMLTYKYLFILMRTLEEMHLARKSRLIGGVKEAEMRRWIANRMAFLFRKTQIRCDEVFKAMVGRGFHGDIKVYAFHKMDALDWFAAGLLFFAGLVFLFM
ncbi:MAG: cobalt ECF transporter T component CbiQ [Thermodesulfobacteriota bacterium]|nr:cobalt ECF transporter T component CbiQ [Thermodesulfobacteriota bacterium]